MPLTPEDEIALFGGHAGKVLEMMCAGLAAVRGNAGVSMSCAGRDV